MRADRNPFWYVFRTDWQNINKINKNYKFKINKNLERFTSNQYNLKKKLGQQLLWSFRLNLLKLNNIQPSSPRCGEWQSRQHFPRLNVHLQFDQTINSYQSTLLQMCKFTLLMRHLHLNYLGEINWSDYMVIIFLKRIYE